MGERYIELPARDSIIEPTIPYLSRRWNETRRRIERGTSLRVIDPKARTTVDGPGGTMGRKVVLSGSFSACQSVHVSGGQRVAADSPVAAFNFLDDAPGDATHVFTLDRDHRVGELAYDLMLLLLIEHVFDDTNLNERHWTSPFWSAWGYGLDASVTPSGLPVAA
jgi:hypothetical protein